MATFDRLSPYLEWLLEDEELQSDIERSLVRGRQALAGALSKKSARKAVEDRRVRARARASVRAARRATGKLRRAPELERRRRRRRQAVALAGVAAVAAFTLSAGAREWIARWLRGVAETAEPQSSDGSLDAAAERAADESPAMRR